MNKKYKILSIVVFMVILFSPSLIHVLKGSNHGIVENRSAVAFPKFPKTFSDMVEYTSSIDQYLNDHFGLRKNFIRLANKIFFYLFKEPLSKNISIGKNGYVYLNSHNKNAPNRMINSICKNKPKSQKTTLFLSNTLTRFKKYMSGKGIKSEVFIVPTKSKIYPEFLPDGLYYECQDNAPSWIEDFIDGFNGLTIYYPLEKSIQWKSQFPVYLSRHYHWHGKYPFMIAQYIMSDIWDIKYDQNITSQQIKVDTDLRVFLPGVHLFNDSIVYDYSQLVISECKGRSCIKNIQNIYEKSDEVMTYQTNKNSDRILLILSDSFGENVAKHFITGFGQVVLINTKELTDLESESFLDSIITQLKPTHLLYLFNDGSMINRIKMLDKLLLAHD